jgi:hypothetical protein
VEAAVSYGEHGRKSEVKGVRRQQVYASIAVALLQECRGQCYIMSMTGRIGQRIAEAVVYVSMSRSIAPQKRCGKYS